MDRIDEWRVFVTVATLRSFSAAARSLGRSPQGVTRAVASLEARLGTRVLQRTTRAVSLTSDGERYLERGKRALAEFDLLESRDDATAPLRGSLAITAPVLFGQLHVLPIATAFLTRHPALDLRLLLLDRTVSLADEGIDVGVRIGALPDSSLRARVVGHVRSVLCASPAYLARAGTPRRLESLANHACIAFTATTPIADRWSFPSPGRRERTVRVHPRLVVNTGQAAIDAAVAGHGIARVLSYQVDRLVAEKKLAIVLASSEPAPSPVQIIQLPGVQRRSATAFADFAAERLAATLRGSRPPSRPA